MIENNGNVLIRQRRVDKGILPGIVATRPVSKYCGESSDLNIQETAAWGISEEIFIGPSVSLLHISRVKSPIESEFGESIEVITNKGIQKQGQPRIEKDIIAGEDQSRRILVDEVNFEIGQPAELRLKVPLRGDKNERVRETVKTISDSG